MEEQEGGHEDMRLELRGEKQRIKEPINPQEAIPQKWQTRARKYKITLMEKIRKTS
jgi:hypothetical protein